MKRKIKMRRGRGTRGGNDQCSLVSSQGNKQLFKETGTPFQLGQLKKMSTTFLPELFLSMATALYRGHLKRQE